MVHPDRDRTAASRTTAGPRADPPDASRSHPQRPSEGPPATAWQADVSWPTTAPVTRAICGATPVPRKGSHTHRPAPIGPGPTGRSETAPSSTNGPAPGPTGPRPNDSTRSRHGRTPTITTADTPRSKSQPPAGRVPGVEITSCCWSVGQVTPTQRHRPSGTSTSPAPTPARRPSAVHLTVSAQDGATAVRRAPAPRTPRPLPPQKRTWPPHRKDAHQPDLVRRLAHPQGRSPPVRCASARSSPDTSIRAGGSSGQRPARPVRAWLRTTCASISEKIPRRNPLFTTSALDPKV
jgi:hypothetical protein